MDHWSEINPESLDVFVSTIKSMSFTQQSFGMSWSFKLPGRQANPYLSRTPIFGELARRRGSVQRSIL